MAMSVKGLQISPTEFWKLTFAEWRPMYEAVYGKQEKKMKPKDLDNMLLQYQKQFEKGPTDGKS